MHLDQCHHNSRGSAHRAAPPAARLPAQAMYGFISELKSWARCICKGQTYGGPASHRPTRCRRPSGLWRCWRCPPVAALSLTSVRRQLRLAVEPLRSSRRCRCGLWHQYAGCKQQIAISHLHTRSRQLHVGSCPIRAALVSSRCDVAGSADGAGREEQRAPRSGRGHPAVQPQHQHQVGRSVHCPCDIPDVPFVYLTRNFQEEKRPLAVVSHIHAAACCAAGWPQRTWCCLRAPGGSHACGGAPCWQSAPSCATATRACFRTRQAHSGTSVYMVIPTALTSFACRHAWPLPCATAILQCIRQQL